MSAAVIRVERARKAIRLLGEARELGVGSEASRLHLVSSLARELGAALGGAVDDRAYRFGGKRGCERATLTGFDPQTLGVYYSHHEHGSDVNPLHHAIIARRARGQCADVTTVVAHELVAPRTWARAPWVAETVRPARLDHFLASVRFVGPGRVQGFGFMRAFGDRTFSADDRAYLHLVASECSTLFVEAEPRPHLAPRAADTLRCLLTGASDKEIALSLGLSVHTVHQYVKAIFRAYGVSSRAQLLARARR